MRRRRICISLLISLVVAIGMSLTACKKDNNPNARFLGTYTGISNFGLSPVYDTVVITAGSTPTSIVILEKLNSTGYNATINGDSITIPGGQQSNINTAALTITGGSGVLNGDSLTLNATGEYTYLATQFSFSFQGTKE